MGLGDTVGAFVRLYAGYKIARSGIDELVRGAQHAGLLSSGEPDAPQLGRSSAGYASARPELTDETDARGYVAHRGTANLDQSIAEISALIRAGKRQPFVQEATGKLLARKCSGKWCIDERDWREEMRAIFKYVRARVRYTNDPRGFDVFKSAERTLKWGFGDCANIVIALASMFEAAGYETKLRVLEPVGGEQLHLIALVKHVDNGQWIAADASEAKELGWYPANKVKWHKDFTITA